MAALLKKRALAEYCHTVQEDGTRPAKRLQIVRRSKSSEQWDFNLSYLDTKIHAKEILHNLLILQQAFPPPPEVSGDIIRRLTDFLQELTSESGCKQLGLAKNQSSLETILICKIFSLLSMLISLQSEAQYSLEKILMIGNRSSSHKVISHSVHSAYTIILNAQVSGKLFDQVLNTALNHLKSDNYLIKVRCLEAAGGLCPVEKGKSQLMVVEALVQFSSDQDNRVRTAAFNALLRMSEKGIVIPHELYDKVCAALDDDYQCVRESALSLIKSLAASDPEHMICVQGSKHHIRLVDHAFSHICNSVNDVSVRVRTLAVSLLGSLSGVSDHFLHQTLDKKLMSNMKKRSSAHERAKVMVSSGEYSTGKKWAADIPSHQEVDAYAVQIISNGACGAFVHGLEDEFLEVRTASLESICFLASNNPYFANQCLDFLVDMFNDEIEDVRLKAIQVLQKIAPHIKLRPDQLDEILHALKDSCLDIRESLHTLLATCRLSTTTCVTSSIEALLDNLSRYTQDKRSIHRCLRQIGINHPELVLALVPQLLHIHPYFDGVEPSVQGGEYICKLILVLNAAAHCRTIIPLLEQHTLRHYVYLRNSMPHLVPQLKLDGEETQSKKIVKTNTANFLKESLEKLARLERSSTQLRLTIYSTINSDLEKLADIEPTLSPAATIAALYIKCMQLFTKIFSTRNWLTPSSLSIQQSGALRTSVDHLLKNTLRLRYAFTNLTPSEEAAIRSLRVRTLALQLVYIVHGSTGSALGLCDNFLEHTEALHRYLIQQHIPPNAFMEAVVQELSQLEEPRPGAVARILQPLLLAHMVPPPPAFSDPEQIKMCWAEILEPTSDNEGVHKLSAGLVVGVELDAELWHIPDLSFLRIRVTYPDHSSHLMIPSRSDLRMGESGCHRLLTKVLISAQVWSEACQVGISLVLDMSEQESLGGRRYTSSKSDDTATTVQLCQPVKVLVWPKQIRKGV